MKLEDKVASHGTSNWAELYPKPDVQELLDTFKRLHPVPEEDDAPPATEAPPAGDNDRWSYLNLKMYLPRSLAKYEGIFKLDDPGLVKKILRYGREVLATKGAPTINRPLYLSANILSLFPGLVELLPADKREGQRAKYGLVVWLQKCVSGKNTLYKNFCVMCKEYDIWRNESSKPFVHKDKRANAPGLFPLAHFYSLLSNNPGKLVGLEGQPDPLIRKALTEAIWAGGATLWVCLGLVPLIDQLHEQVLDKGTDLVKASEDEIELACNQVSDLNLSDKPDWLNLKLDCSNLLKQFVFLLQNETSEPARDACYKLLCDVLFIRNDYCATTRKDASIKGIIYHASFYRESPPPTGSGSLTPVTPFHSQQPRPLEPGGSLPGSSGRPPLYPTSTSFNIPQNPSANRSCHQPLQAESNQQSPLHGTAVEIPAALPAAAQAAPVAPAAQADVLQRNEGARLPSPDQDRPSNKDRIEVHHHPDSRRFRSADLDRRRSVEDRRDRDPPRHSEPDYSREGRYRPGVTRQDRIEAENSLCVSRNPYRVLSQACIPLQ